jgi:transcriptional regulator with XRE-family HTH domain
VRCGSWGYFSKRANAANPFTLHYEKGRWALLANLGKRIKKLRQDRGLTLEHLSTKANLSIGLLSQLERGLGNPSFTTLASLAEALGVSIGSLLDFAKSGSGMLVPKDERMEIVTQAGTANYLLTPDTSHSFEVLLGEFLPFGTDERDSVDGGPFSHPGEEFMFILKGKFRLGLGDETYELSEGDSITFPGSIPHCLTNLTDLCAQVIVVISPPAF